MSLIKLVGGSIGLATEYHAHRKASKSPEPLIAVITDSSKGSYDEDVADDDEYKWELDDRQREEDQRSDPFEALTGNNGEDVDKILRAFFLKHPTVTVQTPELFDHPLPCPVILPQRRPKTNTRGFVRAYAPVLQQCDINQEMWMDFLQGFQKAIKMSPYFHVANVVLGTGASFITYAGVPSLAAQAASIAITIGVEASRRGYTRYQTNKYIDSMNERLFKPRGLYALIMTYKPNSSSADQVVDLNTNITKAIRSRFDGHGSKFRISSGKTYGELQLPESAPLIFPALDALPEEQKRKEAQKSGFLTDYFDRRAQAKFEAENPDSKLNVPRKKFASRFSDPNSPIYNQNLNLGSLVNGAAGIINGRRGNSELASTTGARGKGGLIGLVNTIGASRGLQLPGSRRELGAGLGRDGRGIQSERGQDSRGSLGGGLKNVMKENVLYLMVVNLPSEDERRAVLSALDVGDD